MLVFVQIVKYVQGSRRQEDTNRIAQQIQSSGYSHHLAPLKHLHQKNHDNNMSDFRLQFVKRADFHPFRPFL